MPPLRIRRRPDGIIELRRARIRDAAVPRDAAILLAMLVLSLGFMTLVAAMMVASPLLITIPGALALVGVWGGGLARQTRLDAPRHDRPPPPRAA